MTVHKALLQFELSSQALDFSTPRRCACAECDTSSAATGCGLNRVIINSNIFNCLHLQLPSLVPTAQQHMLLVTFTRSTQQHRNNALSYFSWIQTSTDGHAIISSFTIKLPSGPYLRLQFSVHFKMSYDTLSKKSAGDGLFIQLIQLMLA